MVSSRPSSPADDSEGHPSSQRSSQVSNGSADGAGQSESNEELPPSSSESGAERKLGSPVVLPQDAPAQQSASASSSTARPLSSQHAPAASPSAQPPPPLALDAADTPYDDDGPLTAVTLNGPSTPATPPRSTPAGSPLLNHSPSSPAFAEAMRRRSRADRSSFLISNAARQLEHRQSVDAGNSKLKEDFERLRAAATHGRSASGGDVSGSSPRSSVAHLQRAASRSRRHSATSRASRKSHADDGSDGGRAIREEDGELVDEPIDPAGDDDAEDVDWSFWGEVMNDYQQVAQSNPTKLSQAIQAGIPDVIRGQIWQLMSSSKDTELESLYSSLLHQSSPHEKAIQKDLTRTFPSHKFFQRPESADGSDLNDRGRGQDELFNVVKAYSLYDPEVGYVQGSAFIVASLLLNMPDEEAFCVWVRLMHSYGLRTSFLPEMPGLQLRLFQFDRLVEDLIPLLHVHFLRNGVKSSMYAGQWFLTLFSYRFPLDCVYRIFDAIFAEGIEAVFRFSVALLLKNEEQLLKLNFEEILKYLQTSLFDSYKAPLAEAGPDGTEAEEEWLSAEFVRDSFTVRITPFQLDGYTAEWDDLCRAQNAHAVEVDVLRTANRQLSSQVKQLESSLATLNTEHCQVVKDLVMAKVAREEMENELVSYKLRFAELSHQSAVLKQTAELTQTAELKQRSSGASSSFWGLGLSGRSSGSKD